MSVGFSSLSELYNIKFFNTTSVEEADVWLFGEEHDHFECKALNGHFISREANNGKLLTLFTESTASMQRPTDIEALKKDLCLAFDPVKIYGWDIKDKLSGTSYAVACTMKCTELEINLKITCDQLDVFSRENISLEKFMTLPLDEVELIKSHIQTLHDLVLSLTKELEQANEERIEAMQQLSKEVAVVGNLRTEAMVATLIKVRELSTTKAVFIAGADHLVGTRYDLSLLYEELSHHKAVILTPKCIDHK